jgi:hypothetical protein
MADTVRPTGRRVKHRSTPRQVDSDRSPRGSELVWRVALVPFRRASFQCDDSALAARAGQDRRDVPPGKHRVLAVMPISQAGFQQRQWWARDPFETWPMLTGRTCVGAGRLPAHLSAIWRIDANIARGHSPVRLVSVFDSSAASRGCQTATTIERGLRAGGASALLISSSLDLAIGLSDHVGGPRGVTTLSDPRFPSTPLSSFAGVAPRWGTGGGANSVRNMGPLPRYPSPGTLCLRALVAWASGS